MKKRIEVIIVFCILICCFACGQVKDSDQTVDTIMLSSFEEFEGYGFTCTGLTYDSDSGYWYVGNYGAINSKMDNAPSIVVLSSDFTSVVDILYLKDSISEIQDVQGVTYDDKSETLWITSPENNKMAHFNDAGVI